jgi:16S rRNA (guanine(1405)-N(7))-methyltransferase
MQADLSLVVEDVRQARKYRYLCEATVRRVAAWALERGGPRKDVVKRTKRKLHQVYGAYLEQWDPQVAGQALEGLRSDPAPRAVRDACRRILSLHSSTRERLELLETLYPALFAVTGVPGRLLDLGCGLHPFALPWMGLPPHTEYHAWEIDARMVDLANRLLGVLRRRGAAVCRDVLAEAPAEGADVAFLLKMIPCLEQQERGCGTRLLRGLNAAFVVVSFPTRTIGGRDKGMSSRYAAAMERILSDLPWPATRIQHVQETFFVLDKR